MSKEKNDMNNLKSSENKLRTSHETVFTDTSNFFYNKFFNNIEHCTFSKIIRIRFHL